MYSGAVQFYFGDRLEQRYPATVRAVTDCRFLALPAQPFAEVFRQWYPMAVHLLEGLFLGQRNIAELVGAAGAAARAGQADRRAHPRAEQPGGRGGPGHRRAARPVRRHAAQAGDARGGQARRRGAAVADRAAGGVRRPRRRRARTSPRWSARTARTSSATGSRTTSVDPAVGAGRRVRRRPGWTPTTSTGSPTPSRRPSWSRRCAGWPTPSRPRRCWPRSPTAPAGSPTWSTPPSSTRRWTGRRTSRPTCTPASTPRW